MAYVIGETCIDTRDASCKDVCPIDDCILGEESDRMLFINPEECIDCGACLPVCPVDAIFPEEGLPEEWQIYAELNRLYFEDRSKVRGQVNKLKPLTVGS